MSKDKEPTILALRQSDSRLWSVRQALEYAVAEVSPGGPLEEANAVLVLYLTKDEKGRFEPEGFTSANLSCVESIALVEAHKHNLLHYMEGE